VSKLPPSLPHTDVALRQILFILEGDRDAVMVARAMTGRNSAALVELFARERAGPASNRGGGSIQM
jgi:hypothetical protein